MYIYRPHRGSLSKAMLEVKEFNNEQEMKKYIVEQWNNCFKEEDIIISTKPVNDSRINWKDSRYVCIKRFGKEDYMKKWGYPQCIGMCATDYLIN